MPGHKDVVNAIYNYTHRLGDLSLDAHQREDALKFLVHFIGDLHNPLHSKSSSAFHVSIQGGFFLYLFS